MTAFHAPSTDPVEMPTEQNRLTMAMQHELWHRLRSWHPDEPGSSYSFSHRLQRENGWTREYTVKAIEEYRRFLFLSQVADHTVCPSEDVDQVWHVHLTYTRSYWEELCGNILRRPLHHQPSKGGQREQELYAELYEQTLVSYATWFGDLPHPHLWPRSIERFAPKDIRRVDRARFLLVPRPNFGILCGIALVANRLHGILEWPLSNKAMGFGLVLLLTPAVTWFGPLDWSGPEFLKWYSYVLIGGVVTAFLIRHILWPADSDVPEDITYFEVACLRGNWKLAVNSVLAKLLASKQVVADVKATKTQFLVLDTTRRGESEFENAVVQSLIRSAGLTMTELHNEMQGSGVQLEDSLRKRGLLTGNASYAFAARAYSFLIMLVVCGLGVSKVNVGLSLGKPVGYLVTLLIAGGMLAVWFLIRPRQTASVRSWLRTQLRDRAGLKDDAGAGLRSSEGIALGTALFGVAALGGSQLLPLKIAWQSNRVELGSTGCATAGCGASGCGGGGSGCGGGGCGGCGGGGD